MAWQLIDKIKGSDGEQGPQGEIGPPGPSGSAAVSADIGQLAKLGADMLVLVSSDDVATSAQGGLADTAVQPGDLGSAALADSGDFATAAQGGLADTAVQPGDLGSAALADSGDFATAAQGGLADSALQSGAPVSVLSSFDDENEEVAEEGRVPAADGLGGWYWERPVYSLSVPNGDPTSFGLLVERDPDDPTIYRLSNTGIKSLQFNNDPVEMAYIEALDENGEPISQATHTGDLWLNVHVDTGNIATEMGLQNGAYADLNLVNADTFTSEGTPLPYSEGTALVADGLGGTKWDYTAGERAFIDQRIFGFVPAGPIPTLSWDEASWTLSLVYAGTWPYYRNSLRYTVTGNKAVTLPGTPPASGMWWVRIAADDGTLSASQTHWTLGPADSDVMVCSVEIDDTKTPKSLVYPEMHLADMNRGMHRYEHLTTGPKLVSGGVVSGYTLAGNTTASNTFGVSEAYYLDETFGLTVPELVDDNGATDQYLIRSRLSGAFTWALSLVPYLYTASGFINWDNAGTLTEAASGRYINTYLLATQAGWQIVTGQALHTSLANAQAETFQSLNLTGLQLADYIAVAQCTWRTGNTYAALGKCRLEAFSRIVVSSITVGTSTGLPGLHAPTHSPSGTDPLSAYLGEELTPVDGVLTIPLNSKSYSCTPTEDITSIVLSGTPTAPMTDLATVHFLYDTAARAIASPATWQWPNSSKTLTTTKDGITVTLQVWSTPQGTVQATTTDFGVPA